MTAKILDGKALAREMRERLKEEINLLKERGITPRLSVILVGENPASKIYVRNKEKAALKVGILSETHRLPEDTDKETLLRLIKSLNRDPSVHAILVQLPLPDHLPEKEIIESVDPKKDADGFHPYNLGRLLAGEPIVKPCTPYGIMMLIEKAGIDLKGKEAVVVGRSTIVGKPMFHLLLSEHATVTVCHSRTRDLSFHTKKADILVVAAGKAHLVKGDMVKEGACVIDVGINRLEDGSLVGDVDFDEVKEIAGWITPVPGGVGPMTVTMLLYNTVELTKRATQGGNK
jgi:methylenetetrahydrofolate dehydrogenase (NADP+)/methenyltetrahydrofolate cyclohydrolase